MATESRAVLIDSPGRARLLRVPTPVAGPGEAVVRIEGSGVCGSDLAVWEGRDWFTYPREPGAPGHEAWGRVEAVGADVHGLAVGDRVTGIFHHAYAEREKVRADELVPVPAQLSARSVPGEAFACAVNAFRRSDVREGQTVAVVGAGFIGGMMVDLCARAGARVIAVSRRGYALKLAEAMGARHAIETDGGLDVVAEVERLTGGALCDRVIEATGKQAPLDLAARLARTRGRLVIVGYHQDGARSVDMQLWNWRGLDVVNAHERETSVYLDGMRTALEWIVDDRFDPFPLITHSFPLEAIDRAFHAMVERPDGFLKGVVRP